ncbi:SPASM domain-containing protein [Patescibacteria group bacterium]|nr:SPASM domain-containing protein [Patescibacteria group bacterium]
MRRTNLPICSSDRTCLRWVSVDPKGELYPCEYLRKTHGYGNCGNLSLNAVAETPMYRQFETDFLTVQEPCERTRNGLD